jgi:hypothetical protein
MCASVPPVTGLNRGWALSLASAVSLKGPQERTFVLVGFHVRLAFLVAGMPALFSGCARVTSRETHSVEVGGCGIDVVCSSDAAFVFRRKLGTTQAAYDGPATSGQSLWEWAGYRTCWALVEQ